MMDGDQILLLMSLRLTFQGNMSNLLPAPVPSFKRFHLAKLHSKKVKLPESLNNSLINQMANFLKNKDFK